MMNRVVNKYILHNRSIFFSSHDEVKKFLEKRSIENSKKHQQPATLNVKSNLDKLTLNDMQVFRFNFRHEKNQKILYLHGGYNTLQPSPFHWRLLDKLTLNTLHEVVLPIYPKSPAYHYLETFKAIRDVYNQLVEEVGADNIVMMGDGSGGGLALSFVQSLINDNQEVPRKLFLLSPLLDATLTNPNITQTLEENDILVSRFGVHQLMKSWANDLPLSDARISPLYGTLKRLPPIYMYGGGREILSPDMHVFTHALEECGNDVEFKEYPKMVHDFPIYPIRQSHKVLKHITKSILE